MQRQLDKTLDFSVYRESSLFGRLKMRYCWDSLQRRIARQRHLSQSDGLGMRAMAGEAMWVNTTQGCVL